MWGKFQKGVSGWGQGGCEPRIELIVIMHKKSGGVGAPVGEGGIRVVVNQKLKLL